MQFGSGILSAEPPVDGDARCVALGFVGRDLALEGVRVGVSETSALRQARLNALNSISAMFNQLACLGVW